MRIALVVPRYGTDVAGGAETLARGLAEELTRRGARVEVWTTCARSHYTWRNAIPPGSERVDGVTVHRFPVTDWDPRRRADLEIRLAAQGFLPADDQYAWLETGAHSAPLYRHVTRHASTFDALLVLPYAMPLVHYAAWAALERAVVWPCLHDEPYARMEPTRLLLESVRGVIFNTPEERDLALHRLRIHPRRWAVVGAGVSAPVLEPDQSFSVCSVSSVVKNRPPEPSKPRPFLYVGRLEEGKNLHLLYDCVRQSADAGSDLRLVVVGDGPLRPPNHPAFDDRGFVSEVEKARLCASALALCQPSLNESFALALMEAWLAGRPVLVHADCAVTCAHVRRSRGGLWFRTCDEFAGAVEWLRANPTQATRMGANGRRYVAENYTWAAVADRLERLLCEWRDG